MSASKTKKDCPECSIRPVVFTKYSYDIILDEEHRLKKLRRPKSERTFDRIANKIIQEWGLWSEHQKTKE